MFVSREIVVVTRKGVPMFVHVAVVLLILITLISVLEAMGLGAMSNAFVP